MKGNTTDSEHVTEAERRVARNQVHALQARVSVLELRAKATDEDMENLRRKLVALTGEDR